MAEHLAATPGGPSRRQLLLGAAALAAGGAAWWFGRDGEREPEEHRAVVSGPTPLWTFRGEAPQAAERLTGTGTVPLLATAERLYLLAPDSGAVAKWIAVPPRPGPLADDLLAAGGLVHQAEDGRFLAYGYGPDRSVAVPPETGKYAQLVTVDGEVAFGLGGGLESRLFALELTSGRLRWMRPAREGDGLLTSLEPAPGGRLVARSTRDEVVALNAADGSVLWTTPADQALSWRECDAERVYVARRANGVRALGLADGRPGWVLEDESWRPIRPLAADGALYLLRDSGEVTRNVPADGTEMWSCRLPFRLDSRCRPVAVGGTLFVPGPTNGGVWALDIATGAVRWTFRDAEPGVQVWRLNTDGERLYAGHDRVVYALPVH
ncbi:outer membrane protein assembly factor BamB [Kitasatospora gansuensis]|uniref:Outer membrane protein assembly factor BamB n=1 Tax=Kitasatospora gansuensis TaxID=258050 RepID=A0A7W7WFS3_9ACTN|nr:PQQ-binding-like beta-propeller repeat protein [Kitasatospora gansuensis]MBB4944699.1 outer membrane protein assembly factor BamB [Kitasatospora gansuensis]